MENFQAVIDKFIDTGLTYIWLLFLALWGGTVNYITRVRQGTVDRFSFVELIGEWAISGFSGFLAVTVCMELQVSWYMTAFFTGVAGHMGGRAIFIFEYWVKNRFNSYFPMANEIDKQKETGE